MEDDSYPPGNYAPEPVEEEFEGEDEGAYAEHEQDAAGPSSSARASTKRKREAPDANATLTSEQIQAKLHHLNRSLLAQAKKAQTFELQRLNKHKKDAKRDVSKDGDIDSSIATLKALSLPTLIASALYSKLLKAHLFTHYPILVPLVPAPTTTPSPADSKAANRVLSNKPFAKETAEALARVKTWVDGEFKVQVKAQAREEQQLALEREADVRPAAAAAAKKADKKGKGVAAAAPRGAETADGSEGEASDSEEDGPLPDMVSDGEDGEDGEEVDLANPHGLNADYFSGGSDSDDDDGASQASWSSGSVSSQPAVPSKKAKVARASSSSPPPPTAGKKAPTTKADKVKPIPKKVTSSLFLPSLAAGYTFGGSDSEPEELSDDGKGERKNRRGQRARKAIWEKKYGANANHLKAERAEGASSDPKAPAPVYASNRGTRGGRGGFTQNTRGGPAGRGRGGATFVVPSGTDGGWGKPSAAAAGGAGGAAATAAAPSRGGFAGRGASSGRGGFGGPSSSSRGGFSSSSRGGFSSSSYGGGGAGSAGAASAGPPPAKRDKKAEKALHPSWVAKQKLKEKMSAGVKSAGTKITFD